MRIVMTDPSLFTGRYDDSLCAALARRGHDVTLAGRPLRGTDAIQPEGYRYEPRFFRHTEGLPVPGLLRRGLKAAGYLADSLSGSRSIFLGAKVVHCEWLPLARADRHWLRRLHPDHALVHTVHNVQPFHGGSASAAMQGQGYYDLLHKFDALIVHGEETHAALQSRGVTTPVHVVPHPPMRLMPASEADLAAVPPSTRPRLLFFGTIKPYKGVDLLIEAALALWNEGVDFDLALAGQPFMPIDDLLERVRAAGHGDRLALDLGFLTEGRLDAHLHRADVIAFPYRHIDSSGAFLSALGYGAAMVTSDCGMFARLPAGGTGRFPAGDASKLKDILRPLLADQAARACAAEAAATLGTALGRWDDAAALTEAAYDAALASAHMRGVAV
jgi:glycosyltransferase involved in cell wall biosynthesis